MSTEASKAAAREKLEKHRAELAERKAKKEEATRTSQEQALQLSDAQKEEAVRKSVEERLAATKEVEAPKDLSGVNLLLSGILGLGDADDDGGDGHGDGAGEHYAYDDEYGREGGDDVDGQYNFGAGAAGDEDGYNLGGLDATQALLARLASAPDISEIESFDFDGYEREMKESDDKVRQLLSVIDEPIYGAHDEHDTHADDGAPATLNAEQQAAILASLPKSDVAHLMEQKRIQEARLAELETKIMKASRLVNIAKEKNIAGAGDEANASLPLMEMLNKLLSLVDDPEMIARLMADAELKKAKPQYHFDRFDKMTKEYQDKTSKEDDAWARQKRAERLRELQSITGGEQQKSDNFFLKQDQKARSPRPAK